MRVLLLILAVSLSGCFPRTLLDAPGYNLTIMDARTHKAISGAAVRVNGGDRGAQIAAGTSDATGRVQTARVMHTAWLPLNFDAYVPPIRLSVSADGYMPRELSGFDPLFVPRGCDRKQDCVYNWETVADTARITLEPK
ncbi:MAG TPA: hypothetical protein VMF58_12685 [Rhizomicrobium sp.]|nr:hypothetical protein [Rhizomicrobium sp.]